MSDVSFLLEIIGYWRCGGCNKLYWGRSSYEVFSNRSYCKTCYGQMLFRKRVEQMKEYKRWKETSKRLFPVRKW